MILCDENSPAMRYFRIFVIIILFGYALASMILSITAYGSLSENVTVILDTVNNWKTGTINDVQIADNGNCPAGYELAYEFWWPGVYAGCDCTGANNVNYTALGFSYGSCNSSELAHNCVSSPSYSEVELVNWGSISGTSKSICVERTTENFAEIGPDQGFACYDGGTLCGQSPDNFFCTNQANCPVTSIEVVSSTCGTCLQIDSSKYLKINRDEDLLPLVEFRVNQYGMCNEANQVTRDPDRKYYKFIRDTGSNCYGEGTVLWELLDSITESTIFSYNDITSKITSLASFDYYASGTSGTDYDYNLYNRGYVPFKFQCRANMDNVIANTGAYADIRSAHLALLIVSIISFVVLGVFLPLMEVLNLCGKDLPFFDGSGSSERRRILNCKRILYYFFKFLMLPFQCWAINSLSKTKDLMTYVAGDECSSDYMNLLIQRTADSFNVAFKNDVTAIVLLVVLFLFSLIGFCRKRSDNDDSPRKTRAKVQNMDDSTINNSNRALNQPQYADTTQYGNQSFQQQQPPFQAQPGYQQQQHQQQPHGHMQQIHANESVLQQLRNQQQQPHGFPQQQQQGFPQQQGYPNQQGMVQPQQPQGQTITIQIDPNALQQHH